MKIPSSVTTGLACVVACVAAILAAVMMVGCATAPPAELIKARTAYARASAGPTARLAPADLHRAKVALDQAERALSPEKNLGRAVDFAYIAGRTVQIAEAHAARRPHGEGDDQGHAGSRREAGRAGH